MALGRFLLTKWLGDSWTEFCNEKQQYITERFKSVGFFNDIHGRETHLIKVPKVKDYTPPKKEDPKAVLPQKKRVKTSSTEDESISGEEDEETTAMEEETKESEDESDEDEEMDS